jgi:hypothetical protein
MHRICARTANNKPTICRMYCFYAAGRVAGFFLGIGLLSSKTDTGATTFFTVAFGFLASRLLRF